jgi:REP element-mobilizing transposase RayT
MPDHVHLLFGMRPDESLSDLIQGVKAHSSKWINSKKFIRGKFSWQEGYGGFSYGKSQVKSVIKYIENQEMHHRRYTFTEEYMKLLK